MLLLTVTLINYINRDSKKAMNLLLGSLCIVFSEVMQVAYFYVSDKNIINVTYSVLLIFAFCFFYIQAGMNYSRNEAYSSSINHLKT
jgi:TRAP-type C4-dicarboxylate transport system permease small subunit